MVQWMCIGASNTHHVKSRIKGILFEKTAKPSEPLNSDVRSLISKQTLTTRPDFGGLTTMCTVPVEVKIRSQMLGVLSVWPERMTCAFTRVWQL